MRGLLVCGCEDFHSPWLHQKLLVELLVALMLISELLNRYQHQFLHGSDHVNRSLKQVIETFLVERILIKAPIKSTHNINSLVLLLIKLWLQILKDIGCRFLRLHILLSLLWFDRVYFRRIRWNLYGRLAFFDDSCQLSEDSRGLHGNGRHFHGNLIIVLGRLLRRWVTCYGHSRG